MSELRRNLSGRMAPWSGFCSYTSPVKLRDRSCVEALEESGLNYEIDKRPLYTEDAAKDSLPIPHLRCLVRADEDRPLTIVSPEYTVMQNVEIARTIDWIYPGLPTAAIGQTSARCGICFVVRIGDRQIAGEHHEDYLLVSDDRSGRSAQRIAYCPVRVDCENSLLSALPGFWSVSLPHRSLTLRETAKIEPVLARLNAGVEKAVTLLDRLSRQTCPDYQKALRAVYPSPKAPEISSLASLDVKKALEELYERDNQRVERDRFSIAKLALEMDADYPKNAGTDWHLYNAVAEYEEHLRPNLDDARRGRSALFGDGAQTLHRAFRLVTS